MMASSSVSQESLDIEDYEVNARRRQIRTLRARGVLSRGVEREPDTLVGDVKHEDECNSVGQGYNGGIVQDHVHDSPTRTSAAQRAKDKRSRPNHLQKGKFIAPKDKRRLREKRRSTGVAVHLASTESTGDSLDDDDAEDKLLNDAKRNTPYNEVIDADNPQTPSEVPRSFVSRRNKSPSDLEADLEDNQDYDSTVSQSDTNLTLIGHPAPRDRDNVPSVPTRTYNQSKYGSESLSFRPNLHNDVDSTTTDETTASYSALSRHRKDNQSEGDKSDLYRNTNGPMSPKLPQSPKSSGDSRDAVRPVASLLAKYQARDKEQREEPATTVPAYTGYRSRFKEREFGVARGPVGQQFASLSVNKENREDDLRKVTKELDRERDENRRLQKVVEEKDRRISDLEREVAMMNRDVEDFQEDNDKLQIENRALISAVQQLSRGTNV